MNVLDYPWSEPVIAAALVRQTFQRKCVAVVPNCNWTGHECDLLCVAANLKIIDVEIKITRSDLRADAGKSKWWRRFGTVYAGGPAKAWHNRAGRKVLPIEGADLVGGKWRWVDE